MPGREEIAKRKKYRKEREEMRLELTAAQADIAKAASTLESVRQQYGEQQQELHDDKIALGVLLDEERTATRELRQNLRRPRHPLPTSTPSCRLSSQDPETRMQSATTCS